MIYSDSRYADGRVYRAYNPTTAEYAPTVVRTFPEKSASYWVYEWRLGDRLDSLAYRYYRNSDEWWRIMDFNPEISNPHILEPGTKIRIPNDVRA
jgi:nucleoid-associated protein YgaU